ncbi:unnamed protein product [Chrysoparadoxa australica]
MAPSTGSHKREGLCITVYGSSSVRTPAAYLRESTALGVGLAEGGHTCINGAGWAGCMGALNDGLQKAGGKVRGVIHKFWCVDGQEHPYIHPNDLVIVNGEGLQERKRALVDGAHAIICLPGGTGTYDELAEAISQKGTGFGFSPNIPVVCINVNGFFDGFRLQLQRAHDDGLLYKDPKESLHFVETAKEALEWCIHKVQQLQAEGKDPTTPYSTPFAGRGRKRLAAEVGALEEDTTSAGLLPLHLFACTA